MKTYIIQESHWDRRRKKFTLWRLPDQGDGNIHTTLKEALWVALSCMEYAKEDGLARPRVRILCLKTDIVTGPQSVVVYELWRKPRNRECGSMTTKQASPHPRSCLRCKHLRKFTSVDDSHRDVRHYDCLATAWPYVLSTHVAPVQDSNCPAFKEKP